ncbi:PIN-like domain-containing protein [Stenotrophomonas maltophilia]|uniref:PIN-like domain-containing protein n=1 Tax=Stenotrophomonas maltophilia TaxID=40324 RepID=UPI001F270ABD|nr:PIN-like domain-containing protein [Stenotrophomonas maltophilia]MCF3469149.1 hypothetical protein [Stenotrophomonas maltophilia]
MKSIFPGFYSPTQDELSVLWREGLFILDSSVLLRLYEVPERTRQETFAALQKLGNRLWVPHQAALEYQRNRARTIGIAKGRVIEALEPMQSALASFLKSANSMKLAERGYQVASDQVDRIKLAGDEVVSAARAAIASHVDIDGEDPVRDQLNVLLDGKIGPAPTAADLVEWTKLAEKRFEHRMGPGHSDQTKMKNPTYMMDGLVFDKRYADVYVWKEAISRASASDVTSVVMVTNDKKADWWKITDYGVVGPLPEICAEMRADAQLDHFWMYDLESFLREAESRLDVNVSSTTLSDVAEQVPVTLTNADIELESPFKLTESSREFLRKSAMYRTLSKYSSRSLAKALQVRKYSVLKEESDLAVGYRAGEGACVAVAVQSDFWSKVEGRLAVREELQAIAGIGLARRAEILIVGLDLVSALADPVGVPGWLSELYELDAKGLKVSLLAGNAGHMSTLAELQL